MGLAAPVRLSEMVSASSFFPCGVTSHQAVADITLSRISSLFLENCGRYAMLSLETRPTPSIPKSAGQSDGIKLRLYGLIGLILID